MPTTTTQLYVAAAVVGSVAAIAYRLIEALIYIATIT